MKREVFHWREFFWLWIAGVIGVIAIIPYSLTFEAPRLIEAPVSLVVLIPLQVIQSAILIAIAVGLGLLLAPRAGLGWPLIEAWLSGEKTGERLKAVIPLSVIGGIVVSLIIIGLDVWAFAPRVPEILTQKSPAPIWEGFLASFYGGITEELLDRLFLFSLFAWLFGKISHDEDGLPSSRAF